MNIRNGFNNTHASIIRYNPGIIPYKDYTYTATDFEPDVVFGPDDRKRSENEDADIVEKGGQYELRVDRQLRVDRRLRD